ncbi:MAG: hypothetical protein FD122_1230 [Stygiobacter sp.]|nr:MAG: hypothetical protein FD122_1230 [Stygiobacter sp.]KAF0218191.1 MAG: hypothetical protein FD178_71 [Ignavibacteria bacterium]
MKFKKTMLNETLSLEVKMKLTNKILIAVFALSLAATTLLAIKLTSVVEYTPQPFRKTFVEMTKKFSQITGGYNLEVFMSDKDSLEFYGPDLLVKKYSVIEEQNGKLKIESKVNLAYYPYYLRLKLHVKDLKKISLKNGASINMWQMKGDSLKIVAKDTAIAKVSGSEYKYARLEALGNSIISLEKANSASFALKDEGMIVLNADKIINALCYKEPKTTLIANENLKSDHSLSVKISNQR